MSIEFISNTAPSFSDEFTRFEWAGATGTSGWKTFYYFGGRTLSGNGEQEYYSDPSTQVAQQGGYVTPHSIVADLNQAGDGILRITASKSPSLNLTENLPYVSGLITTEPSFSQKYGYFEMSAKLLDGQGLWPAFWMLPTDKTWPPEIDAMEYFGAQYRGQGGDTQMWWAVHSTNSTYDRGAWFNTGADLSEGFHRYGVLWAPDYITFYFDGQEIPGSKSPTPPEMHKEMYLLANLAVGGNWPGRADAKLFNKSDPAQLPHLDVDYIKAWALPDTTPNPSEPSLSVVAVDANKAEGNTGQTAFTFEIVRSGNLQDAASVSYSVTGSGTNPATPDDFVGNAFPSGSVNFAPDDSTETVTVYVAGDTLAEPNETFNLTLLNPSSGYQIGTATALGTVRSDDGTTLIGTSGSDTLVGSDASDIINGGLGNDRLTGGLGDDKFAFGPSKPTGRDVITDFTPTGRPENEHDVMEFAKWLINGVNNFEKLQTRIQDNADGCAIGLGGGSDITLIGVHKAELTANDFIFL
jgi:beta-glucanase (GH16 family)